MSLPFSEIQIIIISSSVLMVALWHYRREESFRTPIMSTLILTVYGSLYSILMYACATFGARLVDPELMRLDSMMGIHLPSIVQWTRAHPNIETLLNITYASVAFQTGLVIIFRRNPFPFLRRFILGSLACLIIFILCPAAGPFASYGYGMNEAQSTFLAHLEGLRGGWMHLCCRNAQGLITIPSFHVIWAVFLAASARGWWRPFALLLNTAVIISTLTTGWHYGTDLVAGLLVALIVILAVRDK